MKAVVVGAAGQVGLALLDAAPELWHVIGLDRAAIDVRDTDAIDAVFRREMPDVVINAAAYTAVDAAEQDRDTAFAINREGAGNLALGARRVGARTIHISTDFVFDGRSSVPYRTDAAVNPLGIYGASKAGGEAAVLAVSDRNLVVRTAWVYAACGRNFVETMLGLMATGKSLRVVADQVGTPTSAVSLARALWAFARTGSCGIQHFTDAGVASWYDLAEATQELGLMHGLLANGVEIVPIATDEFPTAAKRPPYSVLDKSSTYALLGKPARHWRQELSLMIAAKREFLQNG